MTAKKIAEQIIAALCRRRGFDNVWDTCDEEDQEDILEEVAELVREARPE